MRAFVSIFLFLLFLSQTFSSFVLDGMYVWNKNYVAETLCVNKANPQLHCNGKCYLAKQVQKDGKDAAQPSGTKKDKGDNAYFFAPVAPLIAEMLSGNKLPHPMFACTLLPSYSHSLLKPPRFVFV